MRVDTVIAGGRVVTPDGVVEADVTIGGGRIVSLSPPVRRMDAVDARGCYVLPGGVDPHTHALSDVVPATRSAVHGGTTTVLTFTDPEPGEPPADAIARARRDHVPYAATDVALHALISAPDRLTDDQLDRLRDHGVTGVKLFLAYPELQMMASDRSLYTVLRHCETLGLPVLVHCENGGVIDALAAEAVAARRCDSASFAAVRPPALEEEAVFRTIAVAGLTCAHLYVVHVSCRGALSRIRDAQADGRDVTAEACIHHLILDASRYELADGIRYLVVPPLRGSVDREALWEGLQDGTVATVGSDHIQVRTPDHQPVRDISDLSYGLAGVELRMPLLLSEGLRRGVPITRLVDLVSSDAARVFGLYPRKGALIAGGDADIVIWDPAEVWRVDSDYLHDGLGDTPYAGLSVTGAVRDVWRRGTCVVRDGHATDRTVAPEYLRRCAPARPRVVDRARAGTDG